MIFLADRGFCDYVTLAGLARRGVDSVLRLNHMRPRDFRVGRRLGPYDRLVTWRKPKIKPRTATEKLWRSLPDVLTLRLIRYPVPVPGSRSRYIILVTTLLDPRAYPVSELAQLYLRRWRVELFLRHIKTTLQMDMLTSKSPAMLYREMMMHLIGYNLIRCVMVEAAALHYLPLERISFKGSVDALRHYSEVIAQATSRRQQTQLINNMLAALARDALPDRPGRVEPRHQKRRPKDFPFLIEPRSKLKAKLLGAKKSKKQGS